MNEVAFSVAPFSWAILAITVVTSALALRSRSLEEGLLLYPWDIARRGQWYRLFTYGLVHADVLHLLFNMIALYSITFVLEQVMGTARYAALYCGGMVLSAVIPAWRHRANERYSALGASGAVSALFFAGMLYFPTAKIGLLFLPIPLPWPLFAVLFIAVSIAGSRKNWGNIGHDIHLYGALAGLLLTVLLDPRSLEIFLHGLLG